MRREQARNKLLDFLYIMASRHTKEADGIELAHETVKALEAFIGIDGADLRYDQVIANARLIAERWRDHKAIDASDLADLVDAFGVADGQA